ncbi:MAG: alpha/beta hydrolase [Actinomycetia bacterium]|nr:alpha/beta hydrolase [Actinomycetes bacterium]
MGNSEEPTGAGERLPGTPEPGRYWTGLNGVALAGDEFGPVGHQPVILLHGGGQTRHAWKDTGEKLAAAGYHVVSLDARGHGDSAWAPDEDYGYETMAADIALVAAGFGRPPVLVGASMGGICALVGIGELLVQASALVLVDIAHRTNPKGVARIREFMDAKPDGFESLDEVADAVAAYQPHRPRPKNVDGLAKNVRLAPNGRLRWHWDPAYRAQRSSIDQRHRSRRMTRCARNLDLPVLLVRGGLSDVLTEEDAHAFLELAPHAEYANVTNAAHMVAGDRNDVFGGAVVEFLRRMVPS